MKTLEERFWSKVRKSDGCWEWTGNKGSNGYGRFYANDRSFAATHIALMLSGRPLADGLFALHKCDNPGCVRPDHLFAGTLAENQQDCERKRRRRHMVGDSNPMRMYAGLHAGEKNGCSKLTSADVTRIREQYKAGIRVSLIAEKFGVHNTAIYKILNGKRWTNG